jgi:hypothetical protein
MPTRMNMFISNGNFPPIQSRPNVANLSIAPALPQPPTALNASIIARIHTVKPGCGSCGRH